MAQWLTPGEHNVSASIDNCLAAEPPTQDASLEQLNAELVSVMIRLEHAEKRIALDAAKVDGPVGGVELRDYQLQVLARLRQIRDTMQKEGSSVDQLRKERDEARAERDALQKQVAKLNYRVHHLKQHVAIE